MAPKLKVNFFVLLWVALLVLQFTLSAKKKNSVNWVGTLRFHLIGIKKQRKLGKALDVIMEFVLAFNFWKRYRVNLVFPFRDVSRSSKANT